MLPLISLFAMHVPPNISYQEKLAVFVDFQKADYEITYDVSKQTAFVVSKIEFNASDAGYPIFDLLAEPEFVGIDSNTSASTAKLVRTPDGVTQVRFVDVMVNPGMHTLFVKHKLNSGVSFAAGGVRSGFFFSDLSDRNYLEKYLPSNFEFDQYQMNYTVKVVGSDKTHRVYTNGNLSSAAKNEFFIQYPEYFTSSSSYFHIGMESDFAQIQFEIASKSGRMIPVTIYSRALPNILPKFRKTFETTFVELEKDYTPFLHPRVVIYANDGYGGGMEYCGATVTDDWALPHELTHSYFARGVIPANGSAGWIDEALASWRDNKYPLLNSLKQGSTNMGRQSTYTRKTDQRAYTLGANFMAHLAHLSNASGKNMKEFLKSFLETQAFTPFLTETYQQKFEDFYGNSVQDLFDKYIYTPEFSPSQKQVYNPYHKQLTESDIKYLLR